MDKRTRTRQRILKCAGTLFRSKGFHAVSINEIMDAAKLTRGGFYHHFKSKEALFVEVLRAPLELTEHLRREKRSGRQRALGALRYYLKPGHRHRVGRACTMAASLPEIARCGARARRAYTSAFEELVVELESIAVGDDAEKRERALVAAATCAGSIALARALSDEGLVEDLLDASIAQALRLLGHAA